MSTPVSGFTGPIRNAGTAGMVGANPSNSYTTTFFFRSANTNSGMILNINNNPVFLSPEPAQVMSVLINGNPHLRMASFINQGTLDTTPGQGRLIISTHFNFTTSTVLIRKFLKQQSSGGNGYCVNHLCFHKVGPQTRVRYRLIWSRGGGQNVTVFFNNAFSPKTFALIP